MIKERVMQGQSLPWLDSLAVGMSIICAVHCLVTPIVIGVMPVLASTLWTDKDFHLWMLLLVVPTAAVALFLGSRKHRDRKVLILGALGLTILSGVALYESFLHAPAPHTAWWVNAQQTCRHCAEQAGLGAASYATIVNLLGAGLLTAAHVRNFLLCRRAECCR